MGRLSLPAASFEQMRARAERLVPAVPGVLKEESAFFRRGGPGAAREVLSHTEIERYERRVSELAPPDLLRWLHES